MLNRSVVQKFVMSPAERNLCFRRTTDVPSVRDANRSSYVKVSGCPIAGFAAAPPP